MICFLWQEKPIHESLLAILQTYISSLRSQLEVQLFQNCRYSSELKVPLYFFQDFARYNFSLNRVRQRTSTTCSEFDRMSSLQQHAKLHIELFDAYHTLLFPLSLNK